MTMKQQLVSGFAIAWLSAGPALADGAEMAAAKFINAENRPTGSATLTETPAGVLIEANISGIPAGMHGFHIHETGSCNPDTGFKSAGGHFAPRGHRHGYKSAEGGHAGDMPNQFVGRDGRLRTQILNSRVTLDDGEASLFDSDGAALVIHAGADDYDSQPSGDAGSRIACAVIKKG